RDLVARRNSSFRCCLRRSAATHTCGIQAAQSLVECWDIAKFWMIGEHCDDIAMCAEHIFSESLQRFLRSDFDKDPCTRVVQRPQALDELHRRCYLLREDVDHLRNDIGTSRVEFAIRICNGRNLR